MDSCSILVSSCDKFKSAWHPFFTLLRRYWPQCKYQVYLNTETLNYSDNEVTTLNSKNTSWSGRLIESLERINSDFVIFVLEDFFLTAPVKDGVISDMIEVMSKDNSIAVVYPKHIGNYSKKDGIHPEWIRMDIDKNGKYMVNCQLGIWNRKALLDILKPGMSPWELEREFKIPEDCKYKFYCSPNGNKFSVEGDVFPYYFAIQKGYGIAQSKWLWNNKKFFKKEKIEVDFKELGTLSYLQYIYMKIKIKLRIWRERIIK